MALKYISKTDLENRLTAATVAAIFTEPSGTFNESALTAILEDAEAEVDSYLVGQYPKPLPNDADRLLKKVALDFAVVFAFQRHPEYPRMYGDGRGNDDRLAQAHAAMARVVEATQRLPDTSAKPANVGGSAYVTGPRMVIDGQTGENNGGDF